MPSLPQLHHRKVTGDGNPGVPNKYRVWASSPSRCRVVTRNSLDKDTESQVPCRLHIRNLLHHRSSVVQIQHLVYQGFEVK
ncbi:hypothetical protein L6452_09678 [Arctium lappa]|uniref:Uncharacterized protein n=1 Tax=Arctium lappa TaxID=4217 RepID=A0ACB9DL52_ARCLA|nr:hypothetical protein L6452_09678 [Arctium lappa]